MSSLKSKWLTIAALCIIMVLTTGSLAFLPQKAIANDEPSLLSAQSMLTTQAELTHIDYSLDYQYKGTISRGACFDFNITTASHVYAIWTMDKGLDQNSDVCIFDSNGNTVSPSENTRETVNSQRTEYKYEHSCDLQPGRYSLMVNRWYSASFNIDLTITADPVISLDRTSITALTNPSAGSAKVEAASVPDALGYQYQFSTDASFSSAKTVESSSNALTQTGLNKGTTYYVHVRPYAVYSDGLKVYGGWSRTQSVYVKKLANAVTILNRSKSFSYNALRKADRSFNIIADDKAGANLSYKFTSMPARAKKFVSVNKSTGKVTVKKGLKRGSYSIILNVSAAATSSYSAASKSQALMLRVK